MASLNTRILNNIEVVLPPTKAEQTAIATALNDADALITQLEKLIAKKRQIKQGAIQTLLSPYENGQLKEGWCEEVLESLVSLSATYSKSSLIDESGPFLIMDMGSVSTNGENIADKKTYSNNDLLSVGDLVMPKDDIGGGNIIGKVAYIDADNKYELGDHVYKLMTKSSRVDMLFLSYVINSHFVNTQLRKKVAGSAQLGLGRKSVEEQVVCFPDDIDHQRKIASIIKTMEKEIMMLEGKYKKYNQIKIGMMQNLLTGKIRLV